MASRHDARVCLVTGAASGIGRATALRLAAEGAIVVGCDIRPLSSDGERARLFDFLHVDVTDQRSVDSMVATVLGRHGRVDVLANVAGVMDGYLTVHEIDDATWKQVMGVNIDGPFRLARAVLPSMLESKSGAIVNVASIAALRAGTSGAAYTVSKHALLGLTRAIAWTYAYEGIRCNAVLPGGTETPIVETLEPRSALGERRSKQVLRLGIRMADPGEIASAVSWLASPEASFINGAAVTADGGWNAG